MTTSNERSALGEENTTVQEHGIDNIATIHIPLRKSRHARSLPPFRDRYNTNLAEKSILQDNDGSVSFFIKFLMGASA
jgi:hypothetical protein